MSNPGNRRIEPENFAPAGMENSASPKKGLLPDSEHSRPGFNLFPAILVGALVLVAIAVISFPLFRSEISPPREITATPEGQASGEISSGITPSESPWVDSQLLRARREAQEILEELLGVQQRLEDTRIDEWAEDEYANINELAISGDELYQQRNFEQAIAQYRLALELARELDASIPEVAQGLLAEGQQFLDENQVDQALNRLQLAQALLPTDDAINSTLDRAQVRLDVLDLVDESTQLAQSELQLEQARDRLAEAQDLDPDYAPLDNLLADIDSRILERDYRRHMSEGFSALSNNQYENATRAFELAGQLKPADNAVEGALQQVEAAKLNNARQTALSRASLMESQEQWVDALAIYQGLLAEDASLSAARLGEIRSSARLGLDNRIQEVLENPLSLQSDTVWQNANQTLAEARAIIDPGERLLDQIDELQSLLKNARTPVVVKLESDNMTEVEIYRVGKLGLFVEQAINLNPGNYVIVGRRSGFKDVRIELAIDGSDSEIEVPVVCTVAI